MKLTDLKRELKQLESSQLVELVCSLYKSSKEAKELLSTRFMGSDYQLEALEAYKTKMNDIFFPISLKKLPSLKDAKSLITDFKRIGDTEQILDFMLYYVECGTSFTNIYGDINEQFYSSLWNVFDQFSALLNAKGTDAIYAKFRERINELVSRASHVGWGYDIDIEETACKIQRYLDDLENDTGNL